MATVVVRLSKYWHPTTKCLAFAASSESEHELPPLPTPTAETVAFTEVPVRPSPLTWEGVVQGYGDVSRTATRGTGWRRIAAYVIAAIVLAPIALTIVAGLVVVLVRAVERL